MTWTSVIQSGPPMSYPDYYIYGNPKLSSGQTLNIGLSHVDTFAWIGAIAAAPNTKPVAQLIPDPAVVKKLNLVWLAVGSKDGLMRIKETRLPHLRLAFFTWHNRVEAQHASHTMEELEDVYFAPGFDRTKFLQGGREILDAIAAFWDGLEADRLDRVGQ